MVISQLDARPIFIFDFVGGKFKGSYILSLDKIFIFKLLLYSDSSIENLFFFELNLSYL